MNVRTLLRERLAGVSGRIRSTAWVIRLAYVTGPRSTVAMGITTLAIGILPAVIAWVGKLIVDRVVLAIGMGDEGWGTYRHELWTLVGCEGGLVAVLLLAQRIQAAAQAILKVRLGHRVTDLILEKASRLALAQFEDPDVHDRLTRARRDASLRPFNLVNGTFVVARNLVALASCIVVLAQLSPFAVWVVVLSGLPAFVAELRFSQQLFDQQALRTPEQREQAYLEALLSREDYAKEVKLLDLAEPLLARYRHLAERAETEQRSVELRRNAWGYALNVIATGAFYFAYAWIVRRTVNDHLTLGQMTMYLVVFRQAQQGVTTGLLSLGLMLDDQLYLRDLSGFLELETPSFTGRATAGPHPERGLELEDVSFTYPDASTPTLQHVSLALRPGEIVALVGQNGSGKTTLLKLVTRLYEPTEGRILLDGLDIREWDIGALHERFVLVFQDFVRFKMTAGENIGAGDVDRWRDESRWKEAAQMGLADEFVRELPSRYHTHLGKWFRGGQELSGGQWQKIALSRGFMRQNDPILVLDEPTAALDASAEVRIFEHVRTIRGRQSVLLISHRFGSVRAADRIVVLERGHLVEEGDHAQLMARGGTYARLFSLQAKGYFTGERERDADQSSS